MRLDKDSLVKGKSVFQIAVPLVNLRFYLGDPMIFSNLL